MAPATALTRLTAHEMTARLRAGEVSSVELLEAHLEAIRTTDRALHAWLSVDETLAREAAAAADRRLTAARRQGITAVGALPALLGIPLGFASASFQSIDTVAVQQATEPSMQGRVMALHQMAWYGSTPIGALAMGWVIQTTSPRVPFVLGGVAALGCAGALVAAARQPRWASA